MTRTNVMASSRPQAAEAGTKRSGSVPCAARAHNLAGRVGAGSGACGAGSGGGTGSNGLRQLERQNADDADPEQRHVTVEIDQNADLDHAGQNG